MLRPASVSTPCRFCPKIPEGAEKTPDNAVDLSERNWRAFKHWQECDAIQQWPDDSIVRRNAVIIKAIVKEYERQPMLLLIASLGRKTTGD